MVFNISASTDIDERRSEWPSASSATALRTVVRTVAADLDVEPDVQDVAVLDLVGLAFEPLEAAFRGLRVRAGLDQVVPADDLRADETARDVGVNRGRGVEGALSPAQRPRTRVLLACGEKRDQAEGVAQAAHHLLERRLAVPKRGRLLGRQLGELRLQLEIDPLRPVLDRQQRLRRQRLELPWEPTPPVRERAAGVDVGGDPLPLRGFLPQPLIARLRLLGDVLATLPHMVP